MSSIYKDVAMLTRVIIEMPQLTVKDRNATNAAEAAFGAHNAGAYRKDLYPKHLVDPITSLVASARAYLYSQTRPCAFSGAFLIPNRRIMGYLEQMSKYEVGFWQAVTAFLNNWANVLQAAQDQQQGLFDPTVYPDLEKLRGQFVFEYPLSPVPGGSNAVSDQLDADVADLIKTRIVKDEASANAELITTAYKDLREQVLRIIRQTSTTMVENKKGQLEPKHGKIFDSLTSDINDLATLLRDLQCGGDPKLAAIVQEIDMHLNIPAATLKADPEVCTITANKAKQILEMLS